MPRHRLFAGASLRELRRSSGLNQREMADRLLVSVSYLSQLESDQRPLSTMVAARLRRLYPSVLATLEGTGQSQRLSALEEALADPALPELSAGEIAVLAEQKPDLSDRIVRLHRKLRDVEEHLRVFEETLTVGAPTRPPWERVRDWYHEANNYIDTIDRAAEALAARLPTAADRAERLARMGVEICYDDDPEAPLALQQGRRLVLGAFSPGETKQFQLAVRIVVDAFGDMIEAIVASAEFADATAERLLRRGLANYAAGALLMPYERFRAAAREVRHDVDRLTHLFGVSFEQACHRLSTLQRPGAEGLPVYFCRVDLAGNITKRHSATGLQFARFGGSCPIWIVHEAIVLTERVLVQHAETPDGKRYISMAKGLLKQSGSFSVAPRRYAVALGCEAQHAAAFVYADAIDRQGPPTPIGVSCRLCARPDCQQRAFPPIGREIRIDPHARRIVPYEID